MQIFEYPYVIITILVACILVLGLVGAYFALQGVRAAKGKTEKDFTTIQKLEGIFGKMEKLRQNRCVLYISVSLDNVRSLYSDAKAWQIYSGVKPMLLAVFGEAEIAPYDQTNFVVLHSWDAEIVKARMNLCVEEVNRYLLKQSAINTVEIRFGSCTANAAGVSFDEAINRAKQACTMAEDKDITHTAWDSKVGKTVEKKIKMENNIENEIDNNRFFLEYQPVLDAKTKKIIGAEVLSRLNSEQEGVLTPGSFLSAVNSVGLSDKFDYYIFEKNCKWISNNREQRAKYIYNVNFSRNTICDAGFAERIMEIVEKYKLPYSAIALEVLEDETVTGEAKANMIQNLNILNEKGVVILLDDFGSGYTTFGDLHDLVIHIVKIDKSITQKAVNETGYVIMKNIIQTAKDLGMRTVCEGVETKEQEEAAIKAGCDLLQGFYYYKPMPVVKLEQVFAEEDGGE
ncbi:MAG: EAL domain-containing protein [Clostridia bacterium]|nr:EAL domain-containing protein [Clostridia bacterium]